MNVLEARPDAIREALPGADVVIGAAFRPGRPSPQLVKRDDLQLMREGSVVVDISIDGGGCIESSRETSLADPWFVEEGVVHYAVPNMPAVVPVTASVALSSAVLPYVRALAGGLDAALEGDPGLARGVQLRAGEILVPGLGSA